MKKLIVFLLIGVFAVAGHAGAADHDKVKKDHYKPGEITTQELPSEY